MSKKQRSQKKRTDVSITIDLPVGHQAEKLTFDSTTGVIHILDTNGNTVPGLIAQRAVHYERAKGKKYQSLMQLHGKDLSIGGMEEIASLDSFFVLDTNTRQIEGVRVSAAFFIRLKLTKLNGEYRIEPIDKAAYLYEFHGVPESSNPEMLAILKISNEVLRHERISKPVSIGFVTDSALGAHKEIGERSIPVYGKAFLPKCFRLLYASSDTGQEILNQLMRTCDKTSGNYLDWLEHEGLNRVGLKIVNEDPAVRFRCKAFPNVTVEHELLNELTINPETQITVQFE